MEKLTAVRGNGTEYVVDNVRCSSVFNKHFQGEIDGETGTLKTFQGVPVIEFHKKKIEKLFNIQCPQEYGALKLQISKEDFEALKADLLADAKAKEAEENRKREQEIRENKEVRWAIIIGGDTGKEELLEVYIAEKQGNFKDEVYVTHSFPNAKRYQIPTGVARELTQHKYALNLPNGKKVLAVGNHYGQKWLIPEEIAQQIIEAIEKHEREKTEKAAEKEAQTQAIFEKAKQTETPQELVQYCDDCGDPNEECSIDIVTIYAMPDGTRKEQRSHTW